jgi:hypothetical protein
MHKGYDRPLNDIKTLCDTTNNIGFHLVDGYLDNPNFSWPVYLSVKRKEPEMNKRTELKIVIKSLASVAIHTRLEESKALDNARYNLAKAGAKHEDENPEQEVDRVMTDAYRSMDFYDIYQNLRHQRVHKLRMEARAHLLAYGFINGREYSDMEEKTHDHIKHLNKALWPVVETIVFNTLDNTHDNRQRYEEWLQIAKGVANEPVRKVAA